MIPTSQTIKNLDPDTSLIDHLVDADEAGNEALWQEIRSALRAFKTKRDSLMANGLTAEALLGNRPKRFPSFGAFLKGHEFGAKAAPPLAPPFNKVEEAATKAAAESAQEEEAEDLRQRILELQVLQEKCICEKDALQGEVASLRLRLGD